MAFLVASLYYFYIHFFEYLSFPRLFSPNGRAAQGVYASYSHSKQLNTSYSGSFPLILTCLWYVSQYSHCGPYPVWEKGKASDSFVRDRHVSPPSPACTAGACGAALFAERLLPDFHSLAKSSLFLFHNQSASLIVFVF